MALEDWGKVEADDAGRAKRLAGSYITALVLVAILLGVGIAFGGQIKKQVFEEEVDVKFVPPEAPKAPPPPPPPPRMAAATPAALGQRRDAPPTELPKEAPREGNPDNATPAGPAGEGDPNGVIGGTGRGGVAKPVETAPPAPPAPPQPVYQIAEVSTPPVPMSKAMPAYPDEARKQGIEAVVVVKFIVGENGQVEDIKIVKGHPLFDAAVLEVVRGWTFQPATLEGKVVRMARMVKIPFRLKQN